MARYIVLYQILWYWKHIASYPYCDNCLSSESIFRTTLRNIVGNRSFAIASAKKKQRRAGSNWCHIPRQADAQQTLQMCKVPVIAGNTVWSMPERFEIYIVYKRCYINTLPFLFLSFDVTYVCLSILSRPPWRPSPSHLCIHWDYIFSYYCCWITSNEVSDVAAMHQIDCQALVVGTKVVIHDVQLVCGQTHIRAAVGRSPHIRCDGVSISQSIICLHSKWISNVKK